MGWEDTDDVCKGKSRDTAGIQVRRNEEPGLGR